MLIRNTFGQVFYIIYVWKNINFLIGRAITEMSVSVCSFLRIINAINASACLITCLINAEHLMAEVCLFHKSFKNFNWIICGRALPPPHPPQPPSVLQPWTPTMVRFSKHSQFCVDFLCREAYYSKTRHCKELSFAPFPCILCY